MGQVVSVSMAVDEDTPLCSQAYINSWAHEPIASLRIGDGFASVFGSAAAMRRLAGEAISAAERAEQLERSQMNGTAA